MRKISSFPSLSWERTNPLTAVCFQSSLLQYVVLCFTSNATASFVFLLEGQKQTQPAAEPAFQNNWFRVIPWSVGVFFDTVMLIFIYFFPAICLQPFKQYKRKSTFSHEDNHTAITGTRILWILSKQEQFTLSVTLIRLFRIVVCWKTFNIYGALLPPSSVLTFTTIKCIKFNIQFNWRYTTRDRVMKL